MEMLVATALMAVLAGSLYASLHIAFKARSSALAAMDTVRRCDLSMDLIRADLQGAMRPVGTLAGPFVGTMGAATPGAMGDSLAFFTTAGDIEPVSPGIGDIKKVEYAVDLSVAGQAVLIRRVTTNLLAIKTPEPIQEVVCRDVTAFTLKYFDGSAWQDQWDSTTMDNALPKAVEVTLEFHGPTGGAAARITRIVSLPCGADAALTSSGTGSSTGGQP